MSATNQNGHKDSLLLHGLKRNYYVAHAVVVFIKMNNEELIFNAVLFYFSSCVGLDAVRSTGKLSTLECLPNKRPGTRIYFQKNASLYGPYLALYGLFFWLFFLH